jgi:hypothetical protein
MKYTCIKYTILIFNLLRITVITENNNSLNSLILKAEFYLDIVESSSPSHFFHEHQSEKICMNIGSPLKVQSRNVF